MSTTNLKRVLLGIAASAAIGLPIAGLADGAMRTKVLDNGVCQTTRGGRFVAIPGFPGEKIDRRLRPDIAYLVRRFKIRVTDGYSLDPVHAANGEHPIGLAIDLVPDESAGGSWKKVDRLAHWIEPVQNEPRPPFRWVGYDGDAGHGRGDHMHISWSHSDTSYNKPARTVYTRTCPSSSKPAPPPDNPPPPPDDPAGAGGIGGSKKVGGHKSDRDSKNGKRNKGGDRNAGGGIAPGEGSTSGGISPRAMRRVTSQANASSSIETDGIGVDAP